MAYENTNNAGWSRRGDTWAYNVTFKIKNNEFTFGKEYYTLTVRVNTGSMYAVFSTKYYPATTNDIPALYLFGEQTLEGVNDLLFGTSENGMSSRINIKRTTSNISNVVNATIHSDYGASLEYIYNQANGRLLYGLVAYDNWSRDCTIEIDADFPIFIPTPKFAQGSREPSTDNWYVLYSWDILGLVDDGTCNNYITQIQNRDYSNIDQAVNYYSVTNSIPTNKVYSIQNYFKANGSIIESKGYDFRILPDSKIYFVLTNQIEGDSSPNMILHITNYPCLVKPYHAPDSAYTESSNVDSTYWWGDWQDSDNAITYIGYGSTNIPIFDSEEKGQAYADGEIGEDASINGGSTSIKTSTIGDSLEGTDIPTVNLSTSGVGTYIYALSETQIKDLMSNYLYVTDATLLQNISESLWLWGNNPIDFFIDCYYIPFDITNFYTTNNADMKFGSYRFESSQGWRTFPVVQETNGQRLTLFNTTFEGIYGDWRDYSQFEYDLFLPFYGFFKLDLYKYLNHIVRCEMMFDVTTHNLRYYLFVDDVITDRIDSSVGINLPLMSSDYVNKAKSDRQARRESDRTAYRAMGAFVTGGLAVAGGIASGNASYAVNGGTSAITSVIDAKYNLDALADKVNENATQSVEGAYSSSMNIYDIRYAYLRITESELIIPDKLNELYGYPSYYMGSASALSGYCEISDIRLKSFTGTVEELNALKGALREGVIL